MEVNGVVIRSCTLPLYKTWLKTATPAQITQVDTIYFECERHYEAGGDWLVETMDPEEVLDEIETVQSAKDFCALKVEQELNARWGEDSDPELERGKKCSEWMK